MPSLNNMEMAAAVAANKNIEIKKTFFGLKTQVIYTPTGSPVDCYRKEYAPDAESSLGRMLDNTGDKLAEVAKTWQTSRKWTWATCAWRQLFRVTTSSPPYK